MSSFEAFTNVLTISAWNITILIDLSIDLYPEELMYCLKPENIALATLSGLQPFPPVIKMQIVTNVKIKRECSRML